MRSAIAMMMLIGCLTPACDDADPGVVDAVVDTTPDVAVDPCAACVTTSPCMVATCDPQAGCSFTPKDDVPCDDDDPCTSGDGCRSGACLGSPVLCDDGDPCTDDACGPDGCVSTPGHAPCDDGDPCTLGDHCADGLCAGVPVSCECQADVDCVAFDDGNACTGVLACDTSVMPHRCVVDPTTVVTCPATSSECLAAHCDPTSGACSTEPIREGQACDDGNTCTIAERCVLGTCGSGKPLNCADDDPCTDHVCDQLAGCQQVDNAADCSDGDACTLGDRCKAGACVGGPALGCNDGNPCTDDTCDPNDGCRHTPNVGPCSDGNVCTTGDVCSGGACVAGKLVSCNDGNACTTDWCDPAQGCKHALASVGCGGGEPTTGACTGDDGLPIDCDDGNPCTTDSCEAATGCQHVVNHAACNDGNPCTADTCDAEEGCVNAPTTGTCNDGNLCTTGDACVAGSCVGTAVVCDDAKPCTDDSCNPKTGCVATFNVAPCDDGNACTGPDVCKGGTCLGTPVVCDDADPCTDEACDPSSGCVSGDNAAPCATGVCQAGACVASTGVATKTFSASYGFVDVALDPERHRLYLTYGGSGKVEIVNLVTGATTVLTTGHQARLMSYDAIGDQMVVGVPASPASESTGYVAAIDAEALTMGTPAWIPLDPGPVLTDGTGRVFVVGATNQWTKLLTVRLTTGWSLAGKGSVYAGTKAQMHPNRKKIYGAENGISPSDIERYDILADGTLQLSYDSPYHGTYSMCGDLRIHPNGQTLYTRCGNIFASTEDKSSDMTYLAKMSIGWTDLVFHPLGAKAYVVPQTGSVLHVYDTTTLEGTSTITLPAAIHRVLAGPDYLVMIRTVTGASPSTEIVVKPYKSL